MRRIVHQLEHFSFFFGSLTISEWNWLKYSEYSLRRQNSLRHLHCVVLVTLKKRAILSGTLSCTRRIRYTL